MERWPLCSNTTVLQNSTLLHDQTHGEIQEFFWHRVGNRVRGFETKWLFLVSAKPIKRTRPYLRMTRWSGCECTDTLQRSPQMNCLSEPQTVDAWSTLLSLFDSICRTRVGSDWCSRDNNLQPLSSAFILICFDMRLRSVWQRQRWWCKSLCIKAIIIYINTVFTHRWNHRDGVSAERRGWCRSLTAANSSSIRNRIINSGLPYDEATPVGFPLCFC